MYQGANIERKRNPRERANLFRIFSFIYTIEIFKKSRKRDLIEDDLYEPLTDCETHRIGDRLDYEWEQELKMGRNSFSRALIRVFGKTYLIYGLIALVVKSSLMTVNPLIMGRLVSFFAPGSTMTTEQACYYGGVLLLCGFFNSAFTHQYHLLMSTLGLKIKASIASLIYRKSLKMTASSLMEITSGKLVTLISKDACIFESAICFFHDLWIGLVQMLIMAYVMYRQIQESTFVGIALLVCLIPLQAYIAKFTKAIRLKTAAKTDERLKRMQEILTSIKLLKLYNWGDYYTKLTTKLRIEEMKKLRIIFYLKAIVLIISQISQRLSFFVCILYYVYQGNLITAEKIFVVIGCYANLRFVLSIAVPMCVSQFAEVRSSMKRIKQCLLIADVPNTTSNEISSEIKIKAASASVHFCGQTILHNISFRAQSSCLIGVTGCVGSGKSTFLKMLLKDMHLTSGYVTVYGTTSYASQEPWLFPGTIKQNILFGQTYNKERYEQVLRSCALIKDLEGFTLKDNTVVNDKGLNLSKGQQARINLARAVYKEADIYLLDDVMVALDATVSKYLFEHCVQGLLKNKLVVFVCHNKNYLQHTDRIVVLAQGEVQAEGQYYDLVNEGIDFTVDSIDAIMESKDKVEKKDEQESASDEDTTLLQGVKDVKFQRLYQENKEEGKVKWQVYKSYLDSAGGWKILALIMGLFLFSQTFTSCFDLFLAKWIKIEEHLSDLMYNITQNRTNETFTSDTFIDATKTHIDSMFIYSFLMGMVVLTMFMQIFTFFTITNRASQNLHNNVFMKITSATMNFFDCNLSGNILNRFSKDIGSIDEHLPYALFETFRVMFTTVGIGSVICFLNPMFIAPTLIVLSVMIASRHNFLNASRGLKRLDGATRAPVIGFLNSSLEGLTTIRACGNQDLLTRQFERHQDLNTSAMFMYLSISRAFAFWLDTMCKIYISIILYSFIFFTDRGTGNAGKVGVVLSQAFGLMGLLQWGIRQSAELENQMTCVERVNEYGNTEQEKQHGLDPDNWPMKGHIEYRNVSLTYFTGQQILQNVNFVIKSGERVGIVGRTGAGKSSIISALFRLYKIQGSIIIDDIDIKDIELPLVRSKISIIPQDPVLFAGTIRSNLDPEGEHTDMQLWNTLGEVELKYDVECLKEGLSSMVQEGGGNFSVGQRQLICLARAVLRDNKILVLDEATANIDPKTDELVQKTIKRLFSHCTILTIAHRLHTVIDSDRILVVDNGEVVDFDTPKMLIQRGHGIFYNMAKQVGLSDLK